LVIKPKRELQPEQAAAAYEIKKHISVTAGPGSGKTTVLVERYLHILREHNLSIDQIVAITFTNRAANEMRERVRERLNQILQTASGDERRRWLDYKRTLDGAVITTIHGFCARLLREFPVEARVDPQFLLLDEHRAAMLLESVVEEALTEFISSRRNEMISRLTLGVGRSKLAAGLVHLYKEIRGQGISIEEIEKQTDLSHAASESYKQALVQVDKSIREYINFGKLSIAGERKRTQAASQWPNLRLLLHAEDPSLADYCAAVERFRASARVPKNSPAGQIMMRLDQELWGEEKAGPLGRVPQICFDLSARRYAGEMVKLLRRISQNLDAEKQKLSALDFDDLELRALDLLGRPEVITRAAERYKFFLVDEFQDTNDLQRRLLERLALQKARRESANLFIVGDRKQSIYGFRGADVDVFREMTGTLLAAEGEARPLLLNFRSQPPLIKFFNYLFARLFQPQEDVAAHERAELGYVEHEASEPKRDLRDSGPLVELMITTEASGDEDDPKAEQDSRELDAEQLARRIISLVDPGTGFAGTAGDSPASSNAFTQDSVESGNSDKVAFQDGGRGARGPSIGGPSEGRASFKYSDIALLFRAMTHVQTYESVFRRANIPYQTVLGRGFYEREEITDLIQLLRFLDNKTDELALAAVLRSPLCGISDNALLALHCAPWLDEVEAGDPLRHFTQTRGLYIALRRHRDIAFITDEEHELLDRAANLIKGLIARRHHYAIGELLRYAVEESEYATVIAATFDGAQRLANVERLFTLAERFERSGDYLIRDFVRYVEEFEAIGSRESEGQIDEATNAVRLMTIHQAKGLEFPIVIIPDLQRSSRPLDNWFLLDRHRGLTLRVPDGRGKLVGGCAFATFEQRHAWREQFESMRLLYVAATRAQDRLILSGTTKDLNSLGTRSDTWLNWIWQALDLPRPTRSTVVDLPDGVQLQLTLNLAADAQPDARATEELTAAQTTESADSLAETFPLLSAIEPERDRAVHRFSVTQLLNYQRCPRQYYFDRILHAPAPDALAVWNDAEAPEPPANLTATLKGAVIHRFCETYSTKDDAEELLRRSFNDVLRLRQAELADRISEINPDAAITELLPLAQNYLSSSVFERIERARANATNDLEGRFSLKPRGDVGLWSELGFRLRRPLGIITGAIDKLLITPSPGGNGFDIEIIDFKTNRLRARSSGERAQSQLLETESPAVANDVASSSEKQTSSRQQRRQSTRQIAFDFNTPAIKPEPAITTELAVDDQVRIAAADYQLQMQAYALAVGELLPSAIREGSSIIATLHFLEPNREFRLAAELLSRDTCIVAMDDAMMKIVSSLEPSHFPVRPATHCRMCNFLGICAAGREWLGSWRRSAGRESGLVGDDATGDASGDSGGEVFSAAEAGRQ
jgi:ATP-dependent helicase/nuclease subunit A